MVRLKEVDETGRCKITMFQFLMVRLKACTMSLSVSKNNSVSIPYGTIKRQQRGDNPNNKTKFQFLMVRLKVTYTNRS